jgi:hypothetical protein
MNLEQPRLGTMSAVNQEHAFQVNALDSRSEQRPVREVVALSSRCEVRLD